MILKSYLSKISYSSKSNFYDITFKSDKKDKKTTFKFLSNDAKKIALANEGIKSNNLKTYHLLFEIRGDRWKNNDGINWMRLALYACADASSHQEAAEWMLNELTTKGNEMYDADYFKIGTLEILI